MMKVAIIGAGPYGLSVAAHLRARGIQHRIYGKPMDTWLHHMPDGMALKSDGFASNLSAPNHEGTLAAYCRQHGIPYHDTDVRVPLEVFNAYALDFQRQFVPDVDGRQVRLLERVADGFSLTLDDCASEHADCVVVAVGITHFAHVPAELGALPTTMLSHSSEHHDLSDFAGREILVVGGGSSAVDLAVLAYEAGAATSLVARGSAIRFDSVPSAGPRSLWARIQRPSSGLGPGWRSWLCQRVPVLYRFLPGRARLAIVRRHLGPRSAWHMRGRLESGVEVTLGASVAEAREEGGRARVALTGADESRREIVTDHVIAATGYIPDIRRLTFLDDELRTSVRTYQQMPILSRNFESSVAGLYFVGLVAANTFGPLMRFMVGAEYAAPRVARRLERRMPRVAKRARTMAPV